METHSINRYVIEWEPFRERAFAFASGAQTPAETYGAIRYAVYQLGDNHSLFYVPSNADQSAQTSPPPINAPPNPDGQLLGGRIGFVRLYGFSFREYGVEELSPHVDTIQGTIREIDSPTVCGWIVDLRLNTGGWIMPMLAGVGPIVGEGLVGYFVSPDSVWQEWFYDDGAAGVRPYSWVGASGTPYELIVPDPNVAVLTGPTTNSAGEAVAIAFRGRPKTRSFGQATAGYSTVLRQDILSDDAELWLTYATDADRARQIYGGVVEPDEFVEGEVADDPASGDAVVDAALAWLLSRDDCSMQP